MKNGLLKILLILPLLLSGMVMKAQPSLGVDAPNVVAVDEVFKIIYTATAKTEGFTSPDFQDFQVLAGPNSTTMTSTTIVNGKRTHIYEVTYTFILQPKKEGKFTIPAASAKMDGKSYSSRSVTIEVVKTQQASSSSQDSQNSSSGQSSSQGVGSEDLILKLSVNKSNVVKGEPIIATLKIYTKTNISGFEDIKFPVFNGFWSQELETPSNLDFVRENYNGQIYSTALIRKYMLLPQQTGIIKIDPAEMVCLVPIRSKSSGRSIFDDFFDDYQTVRKRIQTSAININVSPLPSGAPASFTGGVGDFNMDVKLSKDSISAHEAVSMIVTVSGTGNINLIEAPKVVLPPDFEAYDVKRSEKVSSGATGNTGSKTFEFPFIPRSAGSFEIEPIEFSYYNIKQGKYITLRSAPQKIGVARGNDSGAAVMSNGINKQSVKSIGEDIRFIATDMSGLKLKRKPFVVTWTFYLCVFLIVVTFIALCFILDKTIQRKRDVAGTKNRKAKKMAKMRLKKAETFLKQELYTAFYEELHKAVLGYVSDKLTLPVAELSREKISQELTERGKPEETIKLLLDVIDACEYARYAPSSGTVAMENHYKDAIKVISEIES